MKKPITIFVATSLMLLLVACGATETATVPSNFVTATPTVSQPDTPTPKPPMTEEPMATEESMEKEEPAVKAAATTEVMPTEEMMEPTEEAMETAAEEMMAEEKEEMAEQMDMPQPTAAQQQLLASLKIIGTPPELNNAVWLNSEPLKLADLRGKVVIVEFWTYG